MIDSLKIGTMMIRRTIMVDELQILFQYCPEMNTTFKQYNAAIVDENCLGKVSMSARKLTSGYLRKLYSLDCNNPSFLAFKTLWQKKDCNRNLLAMQCANNSDVVVHNSVDFFISKSIDETITTEMTKAWVEATYPSRFSNVSACSIAKDLNSSWAQAGFFHGTRPRKRIRVKVEIANAVYAFFLAYSEGLRGMNLLENDHTRLLEKDKGELVSLAIAAAQQGLLVFRHLKDVIDMQFPLFSQKEKVL